MSKVNSTAILLFSRTASDEAHVKTFDPHLGNKGNKAIAQELIRQSMAIANQTGLPVFHSYSPQQQGASFGERLANAMETVFEKGFQKVMVIGNDCPSLTSKDLLRASQVLEQQSLVLGPALDGGVYLIGMDQKAYHRQPFIDLDWEKNTLIQSWKSYIECHIQCQIPSTASKQQNTNLDSIWLETQADIDSAKDLQKGLSMFSPISHYLYQKILSILAARQAMANKETKLFFTPLLPISALRFRGPPVC